jgi:hypothetical protein
MGSFIWPEEGDIEYRWYPPTLHSAFAFDTEQLPAISEEHGNLQYGSDREGGAYMHA